MRRKRKAAPVCPAFSPHDVAAFLFCALVLCWLITQGSFQFAHEERFSSAWDSMSRNLLHLDASVAKETIEWEGTVRDGKYFIPNYGILPGVLRIFPNLFFPSWYGQWARLSCWLAGLLTLFAFAWLARRAVDDNPRLDRGTRDRISALSIIGFGFGTPLFFLLSNGRIYHETMLWSLCPAVTMIAVLLDVAHRHLPRGRGLWLLSTFSAIALLGRVTFGMTLALVTVITAVALFLDQRRASDRLSTRALATAALPLVAGFAIQLWYNHQRFDSFFKFYNFTGYNTDPAAYGGVFSWRRLPALFGIYFGFTPQRPGSGNGRIQWHRRLRHPQGNPTSRLNALHS